MSFHEGELDFRIYRYHVGDKDNGIWETLVDNLHTGR